MANLEDIMKSSDAFQKKVVSTATLGASDVILNGADSFIESLFDRGETGQAFAERLKQKYQEKVQEGKQLEEDNPVLSTLGSVLGFAAGAPAGLYSAATRGIEQAAFKLPYAGILAKSNTGQLNLLGRTVAGAGAGAVISSGEAATKQFDENSPDFLDAVQTGASIGAVLPVVGAGASLVGSGISAISKPTSSIVKSAIQKMAESSKSETVTRILDKNPNLINFFVNSGGLALLTTSSGGLAGSAAAASMLKKSIDTRKQQLLNIFEKNKNNPEAFDVIGKIANNFKGFLPTNQSSSMKGVIETAEKNVERLRQDPNSLLITITDLLKNNKLTIEEVSSLGIKKSDLYWMGGNATANNFIKDQMFNFIPVHQRQAVEVMFRNLPEHAADETIKPIDKYKTLKEQGIFSNVQQPIQGNKIQEQNALSRYNALKAQGKF